MSSPFLFLFSEVTVICRVVRSWTNSLLRSSLLKIRGTTARDLPRLGYSDFKALHLWSTSILTGIVSGMNMKIKVFVTGGTFDKEYNELDGKLYFKDTHLKEMLNLGRSKVSVDMRTLMMV